MNWKVRALYIVTGVATLFAGLGYFDLSAAGLLALSGGLVIGSVSIKELIDRNFEFDDVLSSVGLVAGIVLIIASILTALDVEIWQFMQPIVPWAAGLAALGIAIQAFRK